MNFPIISLWKETGWNVPEKRNEIVGTKVSFSLGNAFGHFLEKRLNFWNVNRHLTPYLFHFGDDNHIIPSNGTIELGDSVFLYLPPEGGDRFGAPSWNIEFPNGTMEVFLTPSGQLFEIGSRARYDEKDGQVLVRVPRGESVLIDEYVGSKEAGYVPQRRRLFLRPRTEHLSWRDRGVHFRGWDFTDASFEEAFHSVIV